MANWELIKAEYCAGATPRELEEKHKIKAARISERASREDWQQEKANKSKEIASNFEAEIKKGTEVAIRTLLLEAECSERAADRISAAKGLLDISGLKSEKRELSGDILADLSVNFNFKD